MSKATLLAGVEDYPEEISPDMAALKLVLLLLDLEVFTDIDLYYDFDEDAFIKRVMGKLDGKG